MTEDFRAVPASPGSEPTLDLDALAAVLYSAVVADSLDRHGLRNQVMRAGLRPVTTSQPVLLGWARTAVSTAVADAPDRWYGAEIGFIDSLRPHDVVILQADPAQSGVWGELFSTAATGRGARGAVVDGLVRDQVKIDRLGFPVYAAGFHPADSLGRLSIAKHDTPLHVRGVDVESGDLVIADIDGVVIVPRSVVTVVTDYAVEKATVENSARNLLLEGGTLADVWERYRVL